MGLQFLVFRPRMLVFKVCSTSCSVCVLKEQTVWCPDWWMSGVQWNLCLEPWISLTYTWHSQSHLHPLVPRFSPKTLLTHNTQMTMPATPRRNLSTHLQLFQDTAGLAAVCTVSHGCWSNQATSPTSTVSVCVVQAPRSQDAPLLVKSCISTASTMQRVFSSSFQQEAIFDQKSKSLWNRKCSLMYSVLYFDVLHCTLFQCTLLECTLMCSIVFCVFPIRKSTWYLVLASLVSAQVKQSPSANMSTVKIPMYQTQHGQRWRVPKLFPE